LNQIVRVANETGHIAGLTVKDRYALVRACEGLRDNFRKVIIANLKSWKASARVARNSGRSLKPSHGGFRARPIAISQK
jgi:hypothetical protein